jgi:hypothetical protein
MRALLVMVLLQAAVAAEEDDPKWARGTVVEREPAALPDEDDPKLSRGVAVRRPHPGYDDHPVPRFKLAYRALSTSGLQNDRIDFHAAELDYYPFSGWVRFGLDTELGLAGGAYDAWYFTVGAVLGLQYPWRVTPFLDARFNAGLIGASFMGQSAVSYIYTGGLEAGIELYVVSRLYLTAAVGWAHPVFSGIDINSVIAHPMLDPERKDFAADTFTFKVGFGF